MTVPRPPRTTPSIPQYNFGNPPATPFNHGVTFKSNMYIAARLVTPVCTSSPLAQPGGSQQSDSRSTVARDVRLFTLLKKMNQRQINIEESLNQLLTIVKGVAPGLSDTVSLPEGLILPLQSSEDVEALEEKLVEESTFTELIRHLSMLGGHIVTDATRRAMRHCLTNSLAVGFNWYGHKQKQAFSKLKIVAAVQKAVMRTTRCTAADVEKVCRKWFRTASDRDVGRKKGQKRKTISLFK